MNAAFIQKGPNRQKERELCSMTPLNGASCLLSKECAVSTSVSLVLAIDEINKRGCWEHRVPSAGMTTVLRGPPLTGLPA